MKLKASQIRKGSVIMFRDDLYVMTDVMHVTPGKGPAFIQGKMKSIKSGQNAEYRFRPDESVEKIDLQTRKMEFLYEDSGDYIFMDQETYDQIPLNTGLLGDAPLYMLPNTVVDVSFHGTEPIGVELPFTVELTVAETEPNLKTATVSSSYKPAVMETGLKVQIPPFVEEGEKIRIDTRDGKYLERVK